MNREQLAHILRAAASKLVAHREKDLSHRTFLLARTRWVA